MATRTITTTAVGQASAQPDEVTLRFDAHATNPDVARARREVATQATQLRDVLTARSIPTDQIWTDRFRLTQRPPTHGTASESETQPYHATESVSVTLFERDHLAETLAAAVDEAGVEIEAVMFSFQTETQRMLQREAIADAVTTARQKADAAATAEELALGEVLSIVTDDGSRPQRTSAGQGLGMERTEAGSVESGPIDVHVRVEVEYELVDK